VSAQASRCRRLLPALLLAAALACDEEDPDAHEEARALTGGDPARGRALIQRYGCGSCHSIPDVPGARGTVGPALSAIPSRSYIGGVLQHTPDNLVRWIENPKAVDEKTAMPNLVVTREDARDIAAYLYAHPD
jgi:cytochrome c